MLARYNGSPFALSSSEKLMLEVGRLAGGMGLEMMLWCLV